MTNQLYKMDVYIFILMVVPILSNTNICNMLIVQQNGVTIKRPSTIRNNLFGISIQKK